jgi:acyl-CoA thioester hydrolase
MAGATSKRVTSPTSPRTGGPEGPFTHRLRVRYIECDPQGVVFNVHYFTYFDLAMTELHRELIGNYSAMVVAGADMVVAEARARYRAPARFDEELDIQVRPVRLGTTSLTVQLAVLRGETLLVDGELRYVFIDPATKAKRAMPEDVRVALDPHLMEAPSGNVAGGP